MNIGDIIFTWGMAGLFLSMFLYLLFSQITVKKLRKNPETRENLGVEFISGWDVFNIAQAIALPKYITNKLGKSPISFFYADTELIIRSTSKFDRALAFIFYWLFTTSIVSLLSLAFF